MEVVFEHKQATKPKEREMPRAVIWKLLCILFPPKRLIHSQKTGSESLGVDISWTFLSD